MARSHRWAAPPPGRLVGRCGRAVWQQSAGPPQKSMTQTAGLREKQRVDGRRRAVLIRGLPNVFWGRSHGGAVSRQAVDSAHRDWCEVLRCEIFPQQVILTCTNAAQSSVAHRRQARYVKVRHDERKFIPICHSAAVACMYGKVD